MEATREIYWNVGHGGVPLMYVLAFAAIGFVLWSFVRRLSIWRRGRPLDRFDRPLRRLGRLLGINAGQILVARTLPGKLHALWFWGFVLLFIGTLIVMAQADFFDPLFGIVLMKGNFYRWYSLVLDLAGLVATIAMMGLGVRRYLLRPKGLETRLEDWLVHILLTFIIVTGYLIEGLRMASTELIHNPALAAWSPIGLLVAGLFARSSAATLSATHLGLWWLHFALVIGFILALPTSKLKHIFTTSANAFFAPLEAKGFIAGIDLEDDKITQYGAAKIGDLSWKDLFDADACTTCSRCQDACPAYATDKPLSPMRVVRRIGDLAELGAETLLCEVGPPPAPDSITTEVLWACTTCRACQEACPAGIEQVNKILEMRRNLALMEGEFPDEGTRRASEHLEVNGNPFGLPFASRGDWAEGLEVVDLSKDPAASFDLLYFAGCYASYDARNKKIARSFVEVCAAAGLRVGILGRAEKCCGEPLRKLGNEYLYQSLARENIEAIRASGARRIVTTCPHCFHTLDLAYRDLGLELPVEHQATFIAGLLGAGSLEIVGKPLDCSYHDSCYIGRYSGTYAEPRAVIKRAGGRIKEMEKNRASSFCCGGGGGRILAEEKIGTRISTARATMAARTGAPTLVTNCPFCVTMLEDGVKTGGFEGRVETIDLSELVASRLKTSTLKN